jgi:hypothetical protein
MTDRASDNFGEYYAYLHDGSRSIGDVGGLYATGAASLVDRITHISYTTERGGERAVWEHPFEGRCELLISAAGGDRSHVRIPRDLAVVGWGIALKTASGRRILTPGMAVCATDRGRLRIAWLYSPRYSLAVDDRSIAVTELGIEG